MTKKEARKIYNQKRQEINYSDKLRWDDLILINLQTIELPFLDSVFSFYPMEDRNEVNVFIIT
ncbi:MAG: 5-formyltetrahydrofolate cyclo-ligase, partial [Chitinophagaceae bacterium]